jgi:tRNA nucleotidyltransferase (CCA-adding enzyme)
MGPGKQQRALRGGALVDANSHLQRALSSSALGALRVVGAVARDSGSTAYLVGGPVRDALLGRPIVDLDVSVEGDAIALAGELAARHDVVVDKTHEAFGTATVTFPDGSQVDLATSRAETYEHPAALPTVAPASIREDLLRRDFTINAMAAPIDAVGDAVGFGPVVDLCEGASDLEARRVRILHADSFRDDPTRIFRAVKFARRFDFTLDEDTSSAARAAALDGAVGRLTGARVRNELMGVLHEAEAITALVDLHELGALSALATPFPFDEESRAAASRASTFVVASDADSSRALLIVWLDSLATGAGKVARWLRAPNEIARDLAAVAAVEEAAADRDLATLRPSEWHPLLAGACVDILPTLGARHGAPMYAEILGHWRRFVTLRPFVTGDDLHDLGHAPGPDYSRVLRATFDAQLDGQLIDRERALAFAASQMRA